MSCFTFLCGCWVFDDDADLLFVFDFVFVGLPAFPFGSCVYSGLSWLPLALSPVGNGGTGGGFFGEGPVFALALAVLSGVVGSALYSVLCSDCAAFLLVI